MKKEKSKQKNKNKNRELRTKKRWLKDEIKKDHCKRQLKKLAQNNNNNQKIYRGQSYKENHRWNWKPKFKFKFIYTYLFQ